MSGNGGAASWRGTDDEFGPTVDLASWLGSLGLLGWVIMP
jgi:hypothetical protein